MSMVGADRTRDFHEKQVNPDFFKWTRKAEEKKIKRGGHTRTEAPWKGDQNH
jgi:hypothetical protein